MYCFLDYGSDYQNNQFKDNGFVRWPPQQSSASMFDIKKCSRPDIQPLNDNLLDFGEKQHSSNKQSSEPFFENFKRTNLAPRLVDDLLVNSIGLNSQNTYLTLPRNDLAEPKFIPVSNKSNLNITSSIATDQVDSTLKKAIYENYRQFNSDVCFTSDSHTSLDEKSRQFCTGLERNDSITVQSLQCVAAIVCYRKANYVLVFSPVSQSLAILLKSSFNEYVFFLFNLLPVIIFDQ